MFKRAFTASFDHPGARYHAEGLRYPTFLASKGFFPFSSLSYICVSIKYLWKQSFESLFSGKVKRCFYFLVTRQSCSKKLKNWSRGKWTMSLLSSMQFWYKSVIIRSEPWELTSDEWLTLDLGSLLGALGSVVLGADELSGVAEALAPVCQIERGRVAAKVSNHCFTLQQILNKSRTDI